MWENNRLRGKRKSGNECVVLLGTYNSENNTNKLVG